MSSKKREVRFLEDMVEIDGNQVNVRVELTFNHQNGQFTITNSLKTKCVSRTPDVQKAVAENIAGKYIQLMVEALEMRDNWHNEHPESDGPTLFDEPEAEAGTDDEEVSLSMSARRRSK